MKIILCAWCDSPALHKTREQGAPHNRDACCDRHYAKHFAAHRRDLSLTDMPSLSGRAGGAHKRVTLDPVTENVLRMRGVIR